MRAAIVVLAVLAATAVPSSSARSQGGVLYAFVSAEDDAALVVVEPGLRKMLARIGVPRGPHNVAATRFRRPDLVLVTSPPAGAVTLVNGWTFRVIEVFRGLASPHDVEVSPDSRFAYVTEEAGDRVAVLDLRSRRIVARVRVGDRPHDLAVSPSGRAVWVTHGARARFLTIVDSTAPARPRVAGRVAAPGGHDIAFAPNGRSVWLTYWNSGRVGQMTAYRRTGRLRLRTRVGALAHHVAVSERRIWVTDHEGARAAVLTPRGRIVRRVRTGTHPHHVALLVGRAAVVNQDAGTLSVFEEADGRPWQTGIPVGDHPHGVALVWGP